MMNYSVKSNDSSLNIIDTLAMGLWPPNAYMKFHKNKSILIFVPCASDYRILVKLEQNNEEEQ